LRLEIYEVIDILFFSYSRFQAPSGTSTDHLLVKILDDEEDEDEGEVFEENNDNFGQRELNFYNKAVPQLEVSVKYTDVALIETFIE
jgi:hypothetical protein